MKLYASLLIAVSAVFCAVGASSVSAEGPPTCNTHTVDGDPGPDDCGYLPSCPESGPPEAGPIDPPVKMMYCPSFNELPPAEIDCVGAYGGVFCEAWIQSPTDYYRYVWSAITGVSDGYHSDAHSPFFSGTCTGRVGSVAVTVITPDGRSSYARTHFNCESTDSDVPFQLHE